MKIIIEELKFRAILGILPKERTDEQAVEISCKIDYKYDGRAYIDYDKVATLITRTMKRKKFRLIEEALEFLVMHLYEKYNLIEKIRIKITKPEALTSCKVSAELCKNFS